MGVDQIKIVLNPIYGCIHRDIDTTLICPNPPEKGVWWVLFNGRDDLDSGSWHGCVRSQGQTLCIVACVIFISLNIDTLLDCVLFLSFS